MNQIDSRSAETETISDELWRLGLEVQRDGDIERAADLFRQSIEVHESPEAWCFLGWCHSLRGELGLAISHCRRAMMLDPEFGNAYNDMGAYLVELGRREEAARWFSRAKDARRYDTPQYPFLNLARLYIVDGRLQEALFELQVARALAPGDDRVEDLVRYVGLLMNGPFEP